MFSIIVIAIIFILFKTNQTIEENPQSNIDIDPKCAMSKVDGESKDTVLSESIVNWNWKLAEKYSWGSTLSLDQIRCLETGPLNQISI